MLPPKSTCHDDDTSVMGFNRVMRSLKKADPEFYEMVARTLTHKGFHELMTEMMLNQPQMYLEVQAALTALEVGSLGEAANALARLKDIAAELNRTYQCKAGFVEVPPQKQTVTIYLKAGDRPVVGLPKEIMRQSIRLAKDHGSRRKWNMGFDNRIFIADMEPAAIEALRENPQVDKVEVEGMARIMGYDPILGYDPLVQNTDWGVLAVHPQGAWNKGLYGQNIKVCVIDTGIQKAHEVFWDGGQTVYKGGYNFIGHTTDPEDDHDHGTFCCSIVAAQHNGVAGSFRGIAPGVDLYACKVLDAKGSGSYANIAAAIDWCVTHGMDIISMSLGGGSSSSILQAACDNAWYNGLLLVAAAGNEGPAENTVTYPGKYMSVLAVAAVGYWDDVADFSSRGPEVEIAGPGRGIVGAWAGFTFTDYVVNGSGDRYIRASGTSAACPHVAAAAALMKHWYPLATNLDLRTWLRDNARDI